MQQNTKSLKRNDGARDGIPIAPSKLPRSSRTLIPFRQVSTAIVEFELGFRPKFRGTDGKPSLLRRSLVDA